jgi:hypothetical protein
LVAEQYVHYVTEYYEKLYADKADEFFRRCTFACNENGKPVEFSYTKAFSINNNAAGTYTVHEYKVYVDTKGNTQIRACYIVE